MRVVHYVPVGSKENVGPIQSALELGQAQRQLGADARVWVMTPRNAIEGGESVKGWMDLERKFSGAEPSLLHLHGIWTLTGSLLMARCHIVGIPVVVSPRGMLLRAARRTKAFRKAAYWSLAERHLLSRAALLHCTSESEEGECSGLLPGRPTVIIPNGPIDQHDCCAVASRQPFFLFVGRLHPIKNLESLISACLSLPPGWTLVIAGDGEPAFRQRMVNLATRIAPGRVVFAGWVEGSAKCRLLSAARGLILPSHSENFGNVVIEALDHGTPVIASHGTPWAALETAGAGRWVRGRAEELGRAMQELAGMSADSWRAMSLAASRHASEYQWPAIGQSHLNAYRRILRP